MNPSLPLRLIVVLLLCTVDASGQLPNRLVGYAYDNKQEQMVTDSLRLYYSMNRGGFVHVRDIRAPYTDTFKTDSIFYLTYNPATASMDVGKFLNIYDQNSNLVSKRGYSFIGFGTIGFWALGHSWDYTYDARSNLTSIYEQINSSSAPGSLINYRKYFFRYNEDNQLIADSSIAWTWGAGGSTYWGNSGWTTYQYDQQKDLVYAGHKKWSGSYWRDAERHYYQHTPDHQLLETNSEMWKVIRNRWEVTGRVRYFYDGQGRRDSIIGYGWDTTCVCWKPSLLNHFRYNNSGDLVIRDFKEMRSQGWMNILRDSFIVDQKHDPVLYFALRWHILNSHYYIQEGFKASFTNDHQPLKRESFSYHPDSMYAEERFYYEGYDSTFQPTDTLSGLTIFPSPADQLLHLVYQSDEEQPLVFSMLAADGRLVRQWSEPPAKSFKRQIPVGHLASGNYFLVMRSKTGRMVRPFTVMH